MSRYEFIGDKVEKLKTKKDKPIEPRPISRDDDDEEDVDSPVEETKTKTSIHLNLSKKSLELLNKQINLEFQSFYVYESMAAYFNRCDVALPGFTKFFCANAKEEIGHAEAMMSYVYKRGGTVILQDIVKPPVGNWETPLDAIKAALRMEQSLYETLMELFKLAEKIGDAHLEKFATKYVNVQVVSIKQLSRFVTKLKRVGPNLGEYMFDLKTLKSETLRIKKAKKVVRIDYDSSSSSSSSSSSDEE